MWILKLYYTIIYPYGKDHRCQRRPQTSSYLGHPHCSVRWSQVIASSNSSKTNSTAPWRQLEILHPANNCDVTSGHVEFMAEPMEFKNHIWLEQWDQTKWQISCQFVGFEPLNVPGKSYKFARGIKLLKKRLVPLDMVSTSVGLGQDHQILTGCLGVEHQGTEESLKRFRQENLDLEALVEGDDWYTNAC